MIDKKYRGKDLIGKKCRATRMIRNGGGFALNPGSECMIVDVIPGHGFVIQTPKCPCCGVSVYIRRVSRDALELLG